MLSPNAQLWLHASGNHGSNSSSSSMSIGMIPSVILPAGNDGSSHHHASRVPGVSTSTAPSNMFTNHQPVTTHKRKRAAINAPEADDELSLDFGQLQLNTLPVVKRRKIKYITFLFFFSPLLILSLQDESTSQFF